VARWRRWTVHATAPLVVAVLVAVGVAAGAPMGASSGARTTAVEPHYLLSALSLWEDGNLDVSDERAAVRYRAFHAATLPVQAEIQPDGSQIEPHDPLLPVLLAAPVGLAAGSGPSCSWRSSPVYWPVSRWSWRCGASACRRPSPPSPPSSPA
jgi:hypothetical protein